MSGEGGKGGGEGGVLIYIHRENTYGKYVDIYTYIYIWYIGKTLYGTVYTVRAVAVSGEGGKGRRCQEDALDRHPSAV